ncbi:hypothetical protein L218DRAFT_58669 [Marasmius fiardii PR-910]|nr:hypothetical protein L218DRAFT_58669 [Marasmius fiardii PR-910]
MEISASSTWNETPLGQAVSYLPALGSLLWRSSLHISRIFLSPVTYLSVLKGPLLAPISIILYVLAPFIVFVQIILGLVVFTPYSAFVYLTDAIYPLYVFCGIACIVGVLMGVLGKLLAMWATVAFMELTEKNETAQESSRAETGHIQGTEVKYEDGS